MTQFIDTNPRHCLSAKLAARFALSALLALGAFAAPASAEWHRGYNGWNGGYYHAPPVVYGSGYYGGYYGSPYYAPPVVYGPGIGISLPGINIGIR
jgi:hypothetical protein